MVQISKKEWQQMCHREDIQQTSELLRHANNLARNISVFMQKVANVGRWSWLMAGRGKWHLWGRGWSKGLVARETLSAPILTSRLFQSNEVTRSSAETLWVQRPTSHHHLVLETKFGEHDPLWRMDNGEHNHLHHGIYAGQPALSNHQSATLTGRRTTIPMVAILSLPGFSHDSQQNSGLRPKPGKIFQIYIHVVDQIFLHQSHIQIYIYIYIFGIVDNLVNPKIPRCVGTLPSPRTPPFPGCGSRGTQCYNGQWTKSYLRTNNRKKQSNSHQTLSYGAGKILVRVVCLQAR